MAAKKAIIILFISAWVQFIHAQDPTGRAPRPAGDSGSKYLFDVGNLPKSDTTPTINLHDVNVVYFKNPHDWLEYYKYRSRIEKVMPYVKIAKQLYVEMKEEKDTANHREYHHYKHDLEKEMRDRFEKELKDLTVGQGEMFFKLLNRETGNNAYNILKDLKGPLNAWIYQLIGKKYGYDLKANYDPQKEKLIETIIKQMGAAYNI